MSWVHLSAASSVSPGRRLDSQAAAAAHSCGHRFTARVTPLLQHLLTRHLTLLTRHLYSANALLSAEEISALVDAGTVLKNTIPEKMHLLLKVHSASSASAKRYIQCNQYAALQWMKKSLQLEQIIVWLMRVM